MQRRRRINFGDSWNLVDQAPDTPAGGSSLLAKLIVATWYSIVGMPLEGPRPRRRATAKKVKTRTRTAAERSKGKRRKRRLRRN